MIKLNIKGVSKDKVTKPLAEQLKVKDHGLDLSTKTVVNPIIASLEKKPEPKAEILNSDDDFIPQVTTEKYAILATSSDTLNQKTIDEFNLRMNFVISSMQNEDLHNATLRVLEYCQEHNELQQFLREDDIQIFVKGARNSYAHIAEKKTKKRTKKTTSSALDIDIMNDLMDLDISI